MTDLAIIYKKKKLHLFFIKNKIGFHEKNWVENILEYVDASTYKLYSLKFERINDQSLWLVLPSFFFSTGRIH